jgi:2-keto-4-pentenoate hydratase/2-oxohepta-3-ene-1,7-dioic acid hydratase in catechol pathway
MRIANAANRLALLNGESTVDVAAASAGRFDSDPQAIYERWDEFVLWASGAERAGGESALDLAALGSPSPRPRQVFAVGLNYSQHVAESPFMAPEASPPIFTKFQSCLSGPYTEVVLPADGHTDWEVELVVVIGRAAARVDERAAWLHVAGLAVGQDISERKLQLSGPAPQFSLGKSHPGFGPIGPCLVTADEFSNPDDLELGCSINGEQVQKGRTSQLLFPVPKLISLLSNVLPLLPGDVIFTGTPNGVGMGRSPQRWLRPGDELVSYIEGIGELRQHFVAARSGR